MDRVPDGISSMLKDLEDHIVCAGLDDMKQWAEVITQVLCIYDLLILSVLKAEL